MRFTLASLVRSRLTALCALLLAVAMGGCADGSLLNPGDSGGGRLMLRPTFSASSSLVMAADINLIRITVTETPSGRQLVRTTTEVDPSSSEWELPVEVDPGVDVFILVELINDGPPGQIVQFSGIIGPVTIQAGPQAPLPAVRVFPGPPENLNVTALSITPRTPTPLEGDMTVLAANATPATALVIWESRNPAVATVDQSGIVHAVAPGTARIVAVAGPKSDSITVTVGARATRFTVSPDVVELASIGTDATFTARLFDARNAEITGVTVTWTIDDPTVVSMVSPGVFRSLHNGETTVRATAVQGGNTFTASGIVRVTQAAHTVSIAPATHSFNALGQTQQFTYQVKDAAGNVIAGVPGTFVSRDPNVATVDANGRVTAVGNGSTHIVVTAAGRQDSATVTVQQAAVNFAITPETVTLSALFATTTLVAAMRDANGNAMPTPLVVWSTLSPAIATVDQHGVVTAQANGVARIVAVSGSFADTATVTVHRTAYRLEFRAVTDSLSAGGNFQFTAVAIDQGGFIITGYPLTWTSSNPAAATVDGTGNVHAVAAGETDISASADGLTITHHVVVRATGGFEFGDGHILLYHADGAGAQTLKDRLVALGIDPDSIDVVDMTETPLPLEVLSHYGSVLAWTDFTPTNPAGIGDRLKEYVDAGGKLVLGVYAISVTSGPWGLQGGIMQPGYNPLRPTNISLGGTCRSLDFATALTEHPILDGVTAFSYCINSNYSAVTLDPGATLVAKDNGGVPLIAVSSSGRVVAFNLWMLYPNHGPATQAMIDRAIANALR